MAMAEKAIEKGSDIIAEKAKEIKNNPEKSSVSEVKEVNEAEKKVVQDADVETAQNSSLESVIEDNNEKRTLEKNNPLETDEGKVEFEGLSNEQKEKIHKLTGWSYEVLEKIKSEKEAELYKNAGLKELEVNGKKCLIRDDIDIEQKDEDGITNRQRMERGRPPITKDNNELELHHIGQKEGSPLAELTMEQHRGVGNDSILHDKTKETEINRNEFGKQRHDHWKSRLMVMEGER